MNVNAMGQAVPSARFMGGREYEMIQQGVKVTPSAGDVSSVLDQHLMILPAVDPRTGPYRGREMSWSGTAPQLGTAARATALSFYLAMMTDTCLRLTGAQGPTIVEGPFGRNSEFIGMLEAATERQVLTSDAATGTSIGAALLFGRSASMAKPIASKPAAAGSKYREYAALWRSLVVL